MISASEHLRRILRVRGWRYADLAKVMGETEANIRNKLSRGSFSADWFLAALDAMGCEVLDLSPRDVVRP